ncbi:MAG: zincin-like metallopeptidase domain-containing protein [Hyphomicrobium sp.]
MTLEYRRAKLSELHLGVTNSIIKQIEVGPGRYRCPWHQRRRVGMTPTRVSNGEPYQGFNRLRLWSAANERGYQGSVWGTFNQWKEKGCRVRRGETQTLILFFKFKEDDNIDDDSEEQEQELKELDFVRPFGVFNIDQVDGAEGYLKPKLRDLAVCLTQIDEFVTRTEAKIKYRFTGGARYHLPPRDFIEMPFAFRFGKTDFSSATETFQSTRLHELAHWTGAEHRLDRQFGKDRNDPVYAFEELVAELTSAFLCADLEIGNPPRPDHAQYMAGYLRVLRGDSRAISKAASKASMAARYLHKLQNKESHKRKQGAI